MFNYSEACARNQQPIYAALADKLAGIESVLELGSGSGQHALHFSAQLPHLIWQCSDTTAYLEALKRNLSQSDTSSFAEPLLLDVNQQWPAQRFDMIYTANSLHIMSWDSVLNLFAQLKGHLSKDGLFCCYGPFKYQGEFTSASNAQFELCLKGRDPLSGVRDFEALQQLGDKNGLRLIDDIKMPANNQLLIWQSV